MFGWARNPNGTLGNGKMDQRLRCPAALILTHTHVAGGQSQWYRFGVGEFTTHFRAYFSGGLNRMLFWGFGSVSPPCSQRASSFFEAYLN